jgi:hypothetical protein
MATLKLFTSALTGPMALVALGASTVIYVLGLVIYRRWFHPLAKVPGPFWASVTTFYQSSYNRKYYLRIEEMHKQYGTNLNQLINSLLIRLRTCGQNSAK